MASSFFPQQSSWDPRVLLNNNDISVKVQHHLVNVYSLLACSTVAAATGAQFDIRYNVHGFLSTIAMFALMFFVMQTRGNTPERLASFLAFGFLQGVSIGSLIELASVVDRSLVPQACVATALTFGAFAVGATLSQRRSLLYLYGLCYSALSWLLWFSFANWFFQSRALHNVQVYAGLGVMACFVAADTQKIIEVADMGMGDAIKDAMELFIDLIGIFVRILIVLVQNSEQQRKRNEDKKNSTRRR